MRLVYLMFGVILLSGCATTTPTSNDDRLQTKALAPGKCGLFGWTTDEKRDFIFYADEKTARYANTNGAVDLVPATKFPALSYLDPDKKPVLLRLGPGEIMSGGMRYSQARIVTQTAEGWERLHPVAIVKSCQPK